jgi:hypothetical protein
MATQEMHDQQESIYNEHQSGTDDSEESANE